MDNTDLEALAGKLTEAQRAALFAVAGGRSHLDQAVKELNALELVHLDVVKAWNGNVQSWAGRLTPLGSRLRSHLKGYDHGS